MMMWLAYFVYVTWLMMARATADEETDEDAGRSTSVWEEYHVDSEAWVPYHARKLSAHDFSPKPAMAPSKLAVVPYAYALPSELDDAPSIVRAWGEFTSPLNLKCKWLYSGFDIVDNTLVPGEDNMNQGGWKVEVYQCGDGSTHYVI